MAKINTNKKSVAIALLGKPNVGKSSFLNLVLGEKISIVSPKPQTTRNNIIGVLTKKNIQLIFIDTPGIHIPKNQLSKQMMKQINGIISEIDVAILMVESGKKFCDIEDDMLRKLAHLNIPVILVINKVDRTRNKKIIADQIIEYSGKFEFSAVVPISVKKNFAIDDVIEELKKFSHTGGFIFDEDYLTDQPEKIMMSEIVREKILLNLHDEVPHGVSVKTESIKKRKDGVFDINIIIYCAKINHKGIIIGKDGCMIKTIGAQARSEIENFFGYKVNLLLYVRTKKDSKNF